MPPTITITENGRTGTVTYTDGAEQHTFHWEFGGGDVVAIIQANDLATLPRERYNDVLWIVAEEVIRQRAPNSHAEIDGSTGTILLREGKGPAQKQQEAAAWVGRYKKLRMKLGLGVLIVGLLAAAFFWFSKKVLMVQSGPGSPMGLAVRTDKHIAVLIQSLDPYLPSLKGNQGNDTYSWSLLLVPLDGAEPKLIPFASGISPNAFSLAKTLGSDGRTLWFDADGLRGVDLRTNELLSEADVHNVDERALPQPWNGAPLPPRPEEYLAAGYFTGPNTWLGLHSDMEAARYFKPKSWVKRVVHADMAKEHRRFHRGTFDADTTDGHHRVKAMTPLGEATYLNAAFLRMGYTSEPIRLNDPRGALMIYTSAPGLKGTLVVARVDTSGTVQWTTDTAIDRFKLEQILPGESSVAFVGTRLPIPGKLSEPLLVIVDNASGAARTISLWR